MADFVGGFQNRAHLMLRWNAKIEQTRRIPDTRNDTIAVSRIESRQANEIARYYCCRPEPHSTG